MCVYFINSTAMYVLVVCHRLIQYLCIINAENETQTNDCLMRGAQFVHKRKHQPTKSNRCDFSMVQSIHKQCGNNTFSLFFGYIFYARHQTRAKCLTRLENTDHDIGWIICVAQNADHSLRDSDFLLLVLAGPNDRHFSGNNFR